MRVLVLSSLPMPDLPVTEFVVSPQDQALAQQQSIEMIEAAFASILAKQESCSVRDLQEELRGRLGITTVKALAPDVADLLGLDRGEEYRLGPEGMRRRASTVYRRPRMQSTTSVGVQFLHEASAA